MVYQTSLSTFSKRTVMIRTISSVPHREPIHQPSAWASKGWQEKTDTAEKTKKTTSNISAIYVLSFLQWNPNSVLFIFGKFSVSMGIGESWGYGFIACAEIQDVTCVCFISAGSSDSCGMLWLCPHSYWKWQFIVDLPIENRVFP